MLNIIWFVLLAVGIIYALLNGNIDAVTAAVFSSAGNAVKLSIELAGVLCLWMGLFKLAERSGIINIIAKIIAPVAGWLFPSVPRDDPAFFAIVMNLAANLLGLGNAATPFGLKAMERLQKLNTDPSAASAPMITFLALNTACITFIPTLVISLRTASGSANPTSIIGATVVATTCGTIFAIVFDRLMRHHYFR